MHESVSSERDVLERIRQEMDKHLRENQAPEDLHDFLVQHWARLMTGIFMAKGNQDADWNAGWDTVNALLWSLSPKFGREETEKMLRMLPSILARLQEGCAALSMRSLEKDAFFERLAMMHAAVARAGLRYPEKHAASITAIGSVPDDETQADLAKLVPHPEPGSASTSTSASTERPEHASATHHDLPEIKPGDRVRFTLAKEDRVLLLNWVSPVGGMFMFANEQGLDALTLTRARLAERFHAGTACLA